MIVSKHVIEYDEMKYRKQIETLLAGRENVSTANISLQPNNLDGWYVVYDLLRGVFIRSGSAEAEVWKRWKGHRIASLRMSAVTQKSVFYSSYLSVDCSAANTPPLELRKGRFSQLVQVLDMWFERTMLSEIVELLQWTDMEIDELTKLTGLRGKTTTQEYKQYRRIAYLCKSAYALDIASYNKISSNPGCEWHLRYFGPAF